MPSLCDSAVTLASLAVERDGAQAHPHWVVAAACGLVALGALVAGSAFGNVAATTVEPRVVAWVSAAVLVVFGVVASSRISRVFAHMIASSTVHGAIGAVRILSAGVGYLIVLFGALAVLNVSIEKILVGAGLAGVVLGIAAQQSLGNVFAGLVLVLARPFRVGDDIHIRSGSLGGVFDARVKEMSLTYVTLETEEGELKVPNSVMLAAGVGRGRRPPLAATPE